MKRWRLAQRRKAIGLSQEQLAETLGVDPSTVGRWERGDTDPQPWFRPRLAQALKISVEELAELLADTGSDGPVAKGMVPITQPAGYALPEVQTASWPSQAKGLWMNQPQLTLAIDVADLLAARDRPRLDRQMMDSHVAIGEALAGLYRTADPRTVLPMAISYADTLFALLLQSPGEVSTELIHLVVGVHAQVGLWACHADLPALAHRFLAAACEIAASAGDRPLQARALGSLSYWHSSAPIGGQGGNPRRTLSLLDDALVLATEADPFTRGWLATWRADQHATIGNLEAAQADIELADAVLDLGDGQLSGFFCRQHYGYGMRGHLNSVRALVHGLAGQTAEADTVFGLVQAQAANVRRQAASYAHQALAYARAPRSDAEAASSVLLRSIDMASSGNYSMGLRRSAGVRAGFPEAWSHLPHVRAVDEGLQQLESHR